MSVGWAALVSVGWAALVSVGWAALGSVGWAALFSVCWAALVSVGCMYSCIRSLYTATCVDTTFFRVLTSSFICSILDSSTHTSILSHDTGGRFYRSRATNVNGSSLCRLWMRAMMSRYVSSFLRSPWRRR